MYVETGSHYLHFINMTTKYVWNANVIGLSLKGGVFLDSESNARKNFSNKCELFKKTLTNSNLIVNNVVISAIL